MSEEERKAIEDIIREITDEDRKEYMSKWFLDDLTILIKLINKQDFKINGLEGDIEGLKLSIKDRDSLIEKKDKIIDLMAEDLTTPINSKEWIKSYYERKVEED